MLILAIETATRRGSLALLEDHTGDVLIGEPARTHGERLPADALALLERHGRGLCDVGRFAVVAGPGSFSGLRVGMAAVQGFALVAGRLVAPVPTLEAMAEAWTHHASGCGPRAAGGSLQPAARRPDRQTPSPERPVIITVLDGQRGDVFFAAWRMTPDEPIERAMVLIEPSVGSAAECVEQVRARAMASPALMVGLDIETHAEALGALGLPLVTMPGTLAEAAARIAARRPEIAGPPHALRPIYIRRPDAVLARERSGRLEPRAIRPGDAAPDGPGPEGPGLRLSGKK